MPAYLAEYNVLSTEKTNQINQSNIVPSSDKKLEEILSHISFAFLGPLYQAGPGASDALDSIFNGTGWITWPVAVIRNNFCVALRESLKWRETLTISAIYNRFPHTLQCQRQHKKRFIHFPNCPLKDGDHSVLAIHLKFKEKGNFSMSLFKPYEVMPNRRLILNNI